MELLKEKKRCCGCQACVATCPKDAITMKEDIEGFLYPHIDSQKCIDCGRCKAVCATQTALEDETAYRNSLQHVYAVKHKDLAIRMESRSGGIFTAISDYVLAQDGSVYGAVFDENLVVRHVRAENQDERNRMRGSKYVQSITDAALYHQVKCDLQEGKMVLYTGTSCQIASLQSYLRNVPSEKLLCIDIVCHGVPSPMVFRDYLTYEQSKNRTEITGIDFRNKKKYGWAGHVETLSIGDGSKDSCLFTMLFYQHNILRPSCYACPYKGLAHPGDITIADYWGIDRALPGFSDNKGVSLVLVNTTQGKHFFNEAKPAIDSVETDIEKSMQPPLRAPFKEPAERECFWNDYQQKGFSYIAKKYAGKSWKWIIKYRVKKLLMDFNMYKVTK